MDLTQRPNAMVSYCVFEKSLWGRGIATAAMEAFINHTAQKFGLGSLGAFTYSGNLSSIRVLEKNGFISVEEFEEDGVRSQYFERDREKER